LFARRGHDGRHAALRPLGILSGEKDLPAETRKGEGGEYGVPRAAKNRGGGALACRAEAREGEGGLFEK